MLVEIDQFACQCADVEVVNDRALGQARGEKPAAGDVQTLNCVRQVSRQSPAEVKLRFASEDRDDDGGLTPGVVGGIGLDTPGCAVPARPHPAATSPNLCDDSSPSSTRSSQEAHRSIRPPQLITEVMFP